jgi:hypothetical protein
MPLLIPVQLLEAWGDCLLRYDDRDSCHERRRKVRQRASAVSSTKRSTESGKCIHGKKSEKARERERHSESSCVAQCNRERAGHKTRNPFDDETDNSNIGASVIGSRKGPNKFAGTNWVPIEVWSKNWAVGGVVETVSGAGR